MQLIGLDANKQLVENSISCLNVQWNRRYYEAGSFMLQLRVADWNPAIVYVYSPERPEFGLVQKLDAAHNVKGDFLEVSGFFAERLANWKVIYPKHTSDGNVCAACKALFTTYMADTGIVVATQADLGGSEAFESEGEYLDDATYAALKKQELSQRVLFNPDTLGLSYEIWQGKDRTQSQSSNTYAVFSQDFGTVDEVQFVEDDSDTRNFALATYTDDNGDPATLEVDIRVGSEPKRVLMVNTGMSREDPQTLEELLAAVESQARTELADHEKIVNLDASAIQNNLRYLIDYDLGDKCDTREDRLGKAFEARIIEVNEVYKENQHTVSLVFGNKIPTIYRRGKI